MKKKGFTLAELLTGIGVMALLVLGSMTLLASSFRSLQRTTADMNITGSSALALRKMTENVRSALSATVNGTGTQVTFSLPALGAADAVTGESEVAQPTASDGVARGYKVDFTAGTLTDLQTNKVLMKGIYSKDPDPNSTQYNQTYQPFQLVTVGSVKALTINLITRDATTQPVRTMRMKTTAILHNMP